MSLINVAQTYRGKILDHAVNISTNEWPQFVCKLLATEAYDPEEQKWVDFSGYDENEITAYVILNGKNGKTLSFDQVKKVTGWDGASFAALNDGDYSEVGIQFRVEPNTYDGKTTLQVNWIDEYDAVPGTAVRKLNPDELKQLDAKFKKALGKTSTPAKAGPVKAKGTKPTSPKGPVKKVETAPPQDTGGPAIPDDLDTPLGECTQTEAWGEVVEKRSAEYDDSALAKIWQGAMKKIGGGKKGADLTDEDWFQVKIATLDVVADIPF